MMTQRRVSTGSSAERASATTMAPRQPEQTKKEQGKQKHKLKHCAIFLLLHLDHNVVNTSFHIRSYFDYVRGK